MLDLPAARQGAGKVEGGLCWDAAGAGADVTSGYGDVDVENYPELERVAGSSRGGKAHP